MAASVLSLLSRAPTKITFGESWEMSNQQNPHLTCIETAPSGPLLVSASEDGTILFATINAGLAVGIVDFGDHLHVLCAVWRDGFTLYIGCSNGVLYQLLINPDNTLHPASMYPIIGPLPHQIISLAIDTSGLHTLLAVGYGSRTSVYAHTPPGHEWHKIEDIDGPNESKESLVNALFFFGKTERKLFIGYSEMGWTIWVHGHGATADVQHFSPMHFPAICRIGQARLSPDQQFVSISTLDQSVAIYSMSDRGPIPESVKAFPLQVPVASSPILPVAHTSTDLVLGGTTGGEVPIVRSRIATIPMLHQGDGHLIRCIAAYGSSVIVGSSGPNGQVMIKCYSHAGWRGKGFWPRNQTYGTPFRVTLSDVLVLPAEAQKRSVPFRKKRNWAITLIQSTGMKVAVLVLSVLMVLALSSSPPGGTPYQLIRNTESTETGVVVAGKDRRWLWIRFGVKHLVLYTEHQVRAWISWVATKLYNSIVSVASVPLDVANFMALGLAKWICERFDLYRTTPQVCPQIIY